MTSDKRARDKGRVLVADGRAEREIRPGEVIAKIDAELERVLRASSATTSTPSGGGVSPATVAALIPGGGEMAGGDPAGADARWREGCDQAHGLRPTCSTCAAHRQIPSLVRGLQPKR